MIFILLAILSLTDAKVVPRRGVDDKLDRAVQNILEYEEPELALLKLITRGAIPQYTVLEIDDDSENANKEKDTRLYYQIDDIKKETDDDKDQHQVADKKLETGDSDVFADVVNVLQYVMNLQQLLSKDFDSADQLSDKSLFSKHFGDTIFINDDSSEQYFDFDALDVSIKQALTFDVAIEPSLISDPSTEQYTASDASTEITFSPDTSTPQYLSLEVLSDLPLVSDASTGHDSVSSSLAKLAFPFIFTRKYVASGTDDNETSSSNVLNEQTLNSSVKNKSRLVSDDQLSLSSNDQTSLFYYTSDDNSAASHGSQNAIIIEKEIPSNEMYSSIKKFDDVNNHRLMIIY